MIMTMSNHKKKTNTKFLKLKSILMMNKNQNSKYLKTNRAMFPSNSKEKDQKRIIEAGN